MIKATIIGVPLDLGAENLGVDIGPNAFRYQGIKEKLENSGFKISDLGNIQCSHRDSLKIGDPKLKFLDEILKVSQQTAKITEKIIEKKEKVIVLGGDHSICLGAVAGASKALKQNLGLIYLDAHGDLNTNKTTMTGNIHGMHLASLLGFGDKKLVNFYSETIKVDKTRFLHIGGYDFDQGELELIVSEKLATYKIIDILSYGFAPLFSKIDTLAGEIWVSLDLDVIDEIYAPGAGMPNKAGLSYREISIICEYIGKICNVVGVDVVEYNPLYDVNGKTAELGIELIAKLFGSNYSWYTSYLEKNKTK